MKTCTYCKPARDIHPLNFGWREDGNGQYLPLCFKGETLSENIPNYNGEIETENGSYDDVRDIDNENKFYKNGYAEFNCESDYDCDEYQSYFFLFFVYCDLGGVFLVFFIYKVLYFLRKTNYLK